MAALVLVAEWITKNGPHPQELKEPARDGRLFCQMLIIVLFIVLTAINGMQVHGIFQKAEIPGWSSLLLVFATAGQFMHVGANQAINFGTYALLPGLAVLLCGASLPEIGFAKAAPKWFRIAGLWLLLPAVGWIIALVTVRATIGILLYQLLRNFLSNGFSEEFLFRGLLFTRLRALMRTEWAMLAQAAIFGLWHFGYDYSDSNRNLLYTVADMISSQVVVGYAMAWLMLKTRNLALPALVHLGFDSLGDAFGAK